jgi:methionyl aminopeptidase
MLSDNGDTGKINQKPVNQKTRSGILIKSQEQINGIRKCGKLIKKTFDYISPFVKEGVSTEKLNELVHKFTIENNAIPAPLNYRGFPKSVCISINEVICHGIPDKKRILENGDIVNIDITSILDGYYADASRMYKIGQVSDKAGKLVDVTKECLMLGINQVKPGNYFGYIGDAINNHASKNGFSVVRDYCGHGVGVEFHEQPQILHYSSKSKGDKMLPGMVFTIEPMINEGDYKSELLADEWTAVTADRTLSAQWEHTVLVTEKGFEILT